jgi:hypothetical protein
MSAERGRIKGFGRLLAAEHQRQLQADADAARLVRQHRRGPLQHKTTASRTTPRPRKCARTDSQQDHQHDVARRRHCGPPVLVPATISLLGRANWWLPAWLDRTLSHTPEDRPHPDSLAAQPALVPR